MIVKVAKMKNSDEVEFEKIENAQTIWIELDEKEKEKLINTFMIRDKKTDKIFEFRTDKIVIM